MLQLQKKGGAWHKVNSSTLHKSSCFDVKSSSNEAGARDSSFKSNSDNDISKTALPAMIISSRSKVILLKFLLSFITTPSKILSVIKVLDPAPRINIFSSLFNFFKKFTNSFKLSALK